MPGSVKCIGT